MTGQCESTGQADCNDNVGCTSDFCDTTTDSCVNVPQASTCTDGLFCNGAETCDPVNDCQPGTAPNCDDGVACTQDSCDETNDVCAHQTNNSLCDDGQFCNGPEICSASSGCWSVSSLSMRSTRSGMRTWTLASTPNEREKDGKSSVRTPLRTPSKLLLCRLHQVE